MQKTHLLEIYDLDNYNGPNPIRVTGVGLVHGPERSIYYILEPSEPFSLDDVSVSQLAVRPHYDGDPITNSVDGCCTVGIAISKPGQSYEIGKNYGFADFCFWKVGKIQLINGSG